MENKEFLAHAAEVFRQDGTWARISSGQDMTLGEVKALLMRTPINGRTLQFYELEEPVKHLAQTTNDAASGKTFVGAILDTQKVVQKRKNT